MLTKSRSVEDNSRVPSILVVTASSTILIVRHVDHEVLVSCREESNDEEKGKRGGDRQVVVVIG